MSRRTATLVVSGALLMVLAVVAALLPVPYVTLSPGPTANTLGTEGDEPLVSIEGTRTYPTEGNLDLTTVAVAGGPGNDLDLLSALKGWFDSDVAVVPRDQVYPPDRSEQEVERENAQQMQTSQQDATAAALRYLDIPVTEHVVVQSVSPDSPAEGVLRAGDVVRAVDGTAVQTPEQTRTAIGRHDPGEAVALELERKGEPLTVTITTARADDGRAVVGFVPASDYTFPFEVDIEIDEVGGPSAGLMFALSIVDMLEPGALTGGEHIAGTGTITDDGEVGPIGGVQQKVVGARDAGATVFLTPSGNCADAAAADVDGIELVKVDTLAGAVEALEALDTGEGTGPTCD